MAITSVWIVLWSQPHPQGVPLTNVHPAYSNTEVLVVAGGKFPVATQPITGVEAPNPLRSGAAYTADYAALRDSC